MKALYLCYFGLQQPLVRNQVLPYLKQLATEGIDVTLVTFEPIDLEDRNQRDKWSLVPERLRWVSLRYHKKPSLPATAFDIAYGAYRVTRLVRRHRIEVVHARAHVPLVMALIVRFFTACRVIFDIRGLMAEEYADAGIWKSQSALFRLVKWVERVGLRKADQVVVLTERFKEFLVKKGLADQKKLEVIPCCVDLANYRLPTNPPSLDSFDVVYAGSVTGLYLLEEMGRLFLSLKAYKPDAFLRVFTTSSPETAAERLHRVGLEPTELAVCKATPEEVMSFLPRARLALSFRKSGASQMAACPTKIPEYLAAGLPVVCSAGAGDMDDLLERERVGIVITRMDSLAYKEAVERILVLLKEENVPDRCREVARKYFDLDSIGTARYRRIYSRLLQQQLA